MADFLTASPSNEHHTAEVLEKIFHFLEACSIKKKTLSKKKGSAKSETVTTRPFKNEFEMKEARHVKKQQSSQTNKAQSTREKGRKKDLLLEWKLPAEAE